MYLAFNNDSTISFNINIIIINYYSYSYYCVINKKKFCCYLVSEIRIL